MRKLILAVLLLFAATRLFAQRDSLGTASHWKKTDIRSYKVTKVTARRNDTGGMISDSLSYTFRFVILDSTATGYRIKWDFDDTPLSDEMNEDEYEDMNNQYGDLQLIYTTDKKGKFKAVENWQDISRYFNLYYDIKLTELDNTDSTGVNYYNNLKAGITTQEGVESMLFNEMRLFHTPYAYKMALGDTLKYDVQKRIEPIDELASGHTKCYLEQTDKQKHKLRFDLINKIDTAEACKKLRAVVKRYIESLPENTAEEKKDKADGLLHGSALKYENTDQLTFDFNSQTGLPSKLYYKQIIEFDLYVENSDTVKEVIIEML